MPVRVNDELLAQMQSAIARVNGKRTDEPFTVSSFIQAAIRDKLNHYNRSSKRRKTDEALPCQPEASDDPFTKESACKA